MVFAHYANAQQVEWLNDIFPLPRTSLAYSFETDNNGNIFFAGYHRNGSSNTVDQGMFVGKYDSLGNCVWIDTIRGKTGGGTMAKIDNNIYLSGYGIGGDSNRLIKFGNINVIKPDNRNLLLLAKYDLQGTAIWVKTQPNVKPIEMKAYNNKLYVVGWADTTVFDSHPFPYTGYFLAQYDTNGICSWVTKVSNELVANIAISDSNNIFVTVGDGYYNNRSIYKYNSRGNFIWSRYFQTFFHMDISADNNGNCYAGGACFGAITFGSTTLYSDADGVCRYIAKLDSTGNYTSAVKLPLTAGAYAIFNSGNNLYAAGQYDTQGSNGAVGFVTAKFTNDTLVSFITIPDKQPTVITTFNQNMYVGGYSIGQFHYGFVTKISESDIATNLSYSSNDIDVSIFPNPTSGIIQIRFPVTDQKNFLINVTNAKGQLILKDSFSQSRGDQLKEIDLSKRAKGIYFIEIVANRKRIVKKVVLE